MNSSMNKKNNISESEILSVGSLLQELYSDNTQNGEKRITTGYKYLDRLIDGLPSGIVVIAGKTNMGRTSLALNMAYRQSVYAKIPVAFYSGRFTERIYLDRLQALALKAPVEKVRWDFTSIKDEEAIKRLLEAPLYLSVSKFLRFDSLLENIEQMVNEKHVRVVYINDFNTLYENEYRFSNPLGNEVKGYNEISYELRKLAQKLGITIIVLADIKSDSDSSDSDDHGFREMRRTGCPMLDDLDYTALRNSANTVLIVHRPEFYGLDRSYNGGEYKNIMFVNAAKNVTGPTGAIALEFNHMSLTLSQPKLIEDEFNNLLDDIVTPLPNAGDDPADLEPEYEGQESEEMKAWHKAQDIMTGLAYGSDDIKQLVKELGLEPFA